MNMTGWLQSITSPISELDFHFQHLADALFQWSAELHCSGYPSHASSLGQGLTDFFFFVYSVPSHWFTKWLYLPPHLILCDVPLFVFDFVGYGSGKFNHLFSLRRKGQKQITMTSHWAHRNGRYGRAECLTFSISLLRSSNAWWRQRGEERKITLGHQLTAAHTGS